MSSGCATAVGEHGRVAAQRLADQDGPAQVELIEYGDDVGDVGGAGEVVRVAFAGAVAALVYGDNPVSGLRCRAVVSPSPACPAWPWSRTTGCPDPPQSRQESRTPSRTTMRSGHVIRCPFEDRSDEARFGSGRGQR
jgi:hypothetical protein